MHVWLEAGGGGRWEGGVGYLLRRKVARGGRPPPPPPKPILPFGGYGKVRTEAGLPLPPSFYERRALFLLLLLRIESCRSPLLSTEGLREGRNEEDFPLSSSSVCVRGEGNPPPSSIHKLCDRSCLSGVEWGKKKGDREETLEGTLRVCSSSSSSSSTSDGFAENEEEEKREEIKQTDESIRDSKGKKSEGERKIGKRWCSVLLESVRAEEKKKRPYPSRIKSDIFVSFLLLKVR